jgi:hypothetical protein
MYNLTRHTIYDVETFPFLENVLSENNHAFEFYNYFVHCQMLRGYRI